ncbi:MAG: hypothetical protein P8X80_15030, partial [Desulfobacterales bacterium]
SGVRCQKTDDGDWKLESEHQLIFPSLNIEQGMSSDEVIFPSTFPPPADSVFCGSLFPDT